MSIPKMQQVQEAKFFHWKCRICKVVAQSPCHLEDQFLMELGIYVDIDWTSGSGVICLSPFHLCCTCQTPKMANTSVYFISVEMINFFCFIYFLLCLYF